MKLCGAWMHKLIKCHKHNFGDIRFLRNVNSFKYLLDTFYQNLRGWILRRKFFQYPMKNLQNLCTPSQFKIPTNWDKFHELETLHTHTTL